MLKPGGKFQAKLRQSQRMKEWFARIGNAFIYLMIKQMNFINTMLNCEQVDFELVHQKVHNEQHLILIFLKKISITMNPLWHFQEGSF